MKKKKFKINFSLILFTILIISFFFLITKFYLYKPSSINFVQYTGELHTQYVDWWDNKIEASKEVEIGDYKFIIKTFNKYWYWDGECEPITCNEAGHGGPSPEDCVTGYIYDPEVDDYVCYDRFGCPLYNGYYQDENGVWHLTVCGGAKIRECVDENNNILYGCSYVVEIYKNNNLIKTLGYDIGCGSNLTSSSSYSDNEISASFGVSKWFRYYECKSIMNQYILKLPSNKIFFNITPSKEFYYTGKNATLDFLVTNNWKNGLYVRSYLEMCIPTIFGDKCKTFTKSSPLSLGTKILKFEIPTTQVTDKIILKPSVEIFLDSNSYNLKGLNIHPYEISDINGKTCAEYFGGRITVTSIDICRNAGYNLISLGKVNGNWSEVQIVPKIIQPTVPTIWEKIKIFFSDILLWIAGLFNW